MPHEVVEDAIRSEVGDGRISRRETLKRMGVAGALAWSAPVLSTLNTPAFAQAGTAVCAGTPAGCPDDPQSCGSSGEFGFCFCIDGECLEDAFCEDLQRCPDGTCPDGFVCQEACCSEPRCVPVCGSDTEGTPIQEGIELGFIRISGLPLPVLP